MTGAGPLPLDIGSIRVLLDGARTLAGPDAATLELSILTLCLPWEAVAIELAEIDWNRGCVPVPARGGTSRMLHLPPEAIASILMIAGTASGSGQAVTGGRGRKLTGKDIRLNRLRDRLAVAARATVAVPDWNFHGIRASAFAELKRHGIQEAEILSAIGLKRPNGQQGVIRGTRTGHDEMARTRVIVGRWNAILRSVAG